MALVNALTRRKLIDAATAAGIVVGLPKSLRSQTSIIGADGMIDFTYLSLSFTVPARPTRVVVIEGRGDLEFATIVGYPVVASGNAFWPNELPGARLGEAVTAGLHQLTVESVVEIDFEQLVSFRPDLIVMRAAGFRGDWYGNELLAAIAPVLAVEVNQGNWREQLTVQASLHGRTEQIEPYLAAYDDRLIHAREEAEQYFAEKAVYFMTANV